jgi:hypothetical protein
LPPLDLPPLDLPPSVLLDERKSPPHPTDSSSASDESAGAPRRAEANFIRQA